MLVVFHSGLYVDRNVGVALVSLPQPRLVPDSSLVPALGDWCKHFDCDQVVPSSCHICVCVLR